MGILTELEEHAGADLGARDRVDLDTAAATATPGIPARLTFGPAADAAGADGRIAWTAGAARLQPLPRHRCPRASPPAAWPPAVGLGRPEPAPIAPMPADHVRWRDGGGRPSRG